MIKNREIMSFQLGRMMAQVAMKHNQEEVSNKLTDLGLETKKQKDDSTFYAEYDIQDNFKKMFSCMDGVFLTDLADGFNHELYKSFDKKTDCEDSTVFDKYRRILNI